MLALLLLAGVPALEPDRHGPRVHGVERILALAAAAQKDAGEWRAGDRAEADRFEGDDTPKAALAAPSPALFDRAHAIAVGCAFDATAPPRHRACAAPPTGPPSSDA